MNARLVLLLIAVLACGRLAAAERTPQALAWMSGCWAYEDARGRHEEIWLAPMADHMPGLARGFRNGATSDLEFLRISLIDDELYYLPQPWGEARPGFSEPLAVRPLVSEHPLVRVHPETGENIVANIGRFGPYIAHHTKPKADFRSLKKDDVYEIELPRALEILKEEKKKRGFRKKA